jgi:hypothetical protein
MNILKPQDIPFPQEPLWKETLNVLNEAESVDVLTNPNECGRDVVDYVE